jgi:hypothetical protein
MMEETVVGPFGGRQLSDADWRKQTGKMHYLRLKRELEPYKNWNKLHFELAAKFCLNRCSDWFYVADTQFVFGAFEDWALFKLWVTNNRMIHEQAELTIE